MNADTVNSFVIASHGNLETVELHAQDAGRLAVIHARVATR